MPFSRIGRHGRGLRRDDDAIAIADQICEGATDIDADDGRLRTDGGRRAGPGSGSGFFQHGAAFMPVLPALSSVAAELGKRRSEPPAFRASRKGVTAQQQPLVDFFSTQQRIEHAVALLLNIGR